MSTLFGQIQDLPPISEGHFIEGAEKRVVFGHSERFWDDYVMRCFTLHPGACSSPHSHTWPHWAVCIGGKGKFKVGEETADLAWGAWVHVPGGITHSFWNSAEEESLQLLCIVPAAGDVNPLLVGC